MGITIHGFDWSPNSGLQNLSQILFGQLPRDNGTPRCQIRMTIPCIRIFASSWSAPQCQLVHEFRGRSWFCGVCGAAAGLHGAPVQSAGTPALSGKLRCRLGPRPAAGPLHRFCTDEPAEPEEEESSGKAAAGQEPSYAPSAHTCWTPRCNQPMLSWPMHILITLTFLSFDH